MDRDELARILGIPKETQDVLDSGSNHPFSCKCQTCKEWWWAMGPDDDSKRPYGPFEIEEIEDGSPKGEECKKMRLEMAG